MKVKFENFQLIADPELYEAMVAKYGAQSYGENKLAIKTNNSFASWMIAEKVGDKYKITPISSQNNERQSLQMEAYWTIMKEFPISEFSNVPQFYKQWFVNRGLMKESIMNEVSPSRQKFSVGDKVMIVKGPNKGKKGKIVDTYYNKYGGGSDKKNEFTVYIYDEKQQVSWFTPTQLQPLKEEKERDYKDEYKKFQSSEKSKKYRAELNKYNRDKGTYGNGDGKDATHKDGKIKGFEDESTNKGRREKSRLKKESDMKEDNRQSPIGRQTGGAYTRSGLIKGWKETGLHFYTHRPTKSKIWVDGNKIMAKINFGPEKVIATTNKPYPAGVDVARNLINTKYKKGLPKKDFIGENKINEINDKVEENKMKITKSRLREIIMEEYQKLNEQKVAVYFEAPTSATMDWVDEHGADLKKLNKGKYMYQRMVIGKGNKKEIWMDNENSAKTAYAMMNKGGLKPKGVGERNGYVEAASYTRKQMIDRFGR